MDSAQREHVKNRIHTLADQACRAYQSKLSRAANVKIAGRVSAAFAKYPVTFEAVEGWTARAKKRSVSDNFYSELPPVKILGSEKLQKALAKIVRPKRGDIYRKVDAFRNRVHTAAAKAIDELMLGTDSEARSAIDAFTKALEKMAGGKIDPESIAMEEGEE